VGYVIPQPGYFEESSLPSWKLARYCWSMTKIQNGLLFARGKFWAEFEKFQRPSRTLIVFGKGAHETASNPLLGVWARGGIDRA